jgi:hypothetical protein
MSAMTLRPQPSPEDLAAFRAAVDGATPLRKLDRVILEAPKPSSRPRQRELDEAAVVAELLHGPLAIDDWLDLGGADSFLRSGLPRTLLRDLRRGRWSIQDHLDLHARAGVAVRCRSAGCRQALPAHRARSRPRLAGAGRGSAPPGQGLAKSLQGCAGLLPRAAQRRR